MVVAAGELVCPERLLVVHPLAAVVAVAAELACPAVLSAALVAVGVGVAAASGRSVKASEVQPLAA